MSTKAIILAEFDHYQSICQQNVKFNHLQTILQQISDEINTTFNQLKVTTEGSQSELLQEQLNKLTDLHRQSKEQLVQWLSHELPILSQQWPRLFELVIKGGSSGQGIDRNTLIHVLDRYESTHKGQITQKEALNQGLDYVTDKHQLPKDFFDRSKLDQFNTDPRLH